MNAIKVFVVLVLLTASEGCIFGRDMNRLIQKKSKYACTTRSYDPPRGRKAASGRAFLCFLYAIMPEYDRRRRSIYEEDHLQGLNIAVTGLQYETMVAMQDFAVTFEHNIQNNGNVNAKVTEISPYENGNVSLSFRRKREAEFSKNEFEVDVTNECESHERECIFEGDYGNTNNSHGLVRLGRSPQNWKKNKPAPKPPPQKPISQSHGTQKTQTQKATPTIHAAQKPATQKPSSTSTTQTPTTKKPGTSAYTATSTTLPAHTSGSQSVLNHSSIQTSKASQHTTNTSSHATNAAIHTSNVSKSSLNSSNDGKARQTTSNGTSTKTKKNEDVTVGDPDFQVPQTSTAGEEETKATFNDPTAAQPAVNENSGSLTANGKSQADNTASRPEEANRGKNSGSYNGKLNTKKPHGFPKFESTPVSNAANHYLTTALSIAGGTFTIASIVLAILCKFPELALKLGLTCCERSRRGNNPQRTETIQL